MRILVMGGSSFVGYWAVEELLARGHDVTLFNRGQTDPGAFPAVRRIRGDRDADLSGLADGEWDATLDCNAYTPQQVERLLDALGDRGGLYAFVSTISTYGAIEAGYDEDSPLAEPAWSAEGLSRGEAYGRLKVACEQVARSRVAERLLVIRPGFVVGPRDATMRYPTWVQRVMAGEPFDGPDPDQPWQGVDARDLGRFVVERIEAQDVTTYVVAAPSPPPSFAAMLEATARGLGVALPEVRWTGEAGAELPLSVPREAWAFQEADVSRAVAAGLTWRPLEDTARDTWTWLQSQPRA